MVIMATVSQLFIQHGSWADQLIGNVHLNVIAEMYSDEIQNALEPFVYELVGTYSLLILG